MAANAAERVPDEVLEVILKDSFYHAPVEWFYDYNERDEFVGGPERMGSPSPLLVCKQWLRVGTPIFYHYVVIRGRWQAARVAEVLRKNADIGPMIQYLRVDHGYGPDLSTIVEKAINVTHLTINRDVELNDNSAAIFKALDARVLRPKQMICWLGRPNQKSEMSTYYTSMCRLISESTSLEHLHIADLDTGDQQLADAVRASQSLKSISLCAGALETCWKQDKSMFSSLHLTEIHVRASKRVLDTFYAAHFVPDTVKKRIFLVKSRRVP